MRTQVTLSESERLTGVNAQKTERLIERHAQATATGIMKALAGLGASCSLTTPGTIGRSEVVLRDKGRSWEVRRGAHYRMTGEGPIGLLCCALGVTPGHAARMVLEMASATRFEPEIAHAIQVAIDAGGCAPGGKLNRAVPPGQVHRAVLDCEATR